jgi:Tol biopolymer transport system component
MSIPVKAKLTLFSLALVALLVLPAAASATLAYVKYGHYPLAPKVFTADDDGFDDIAIGRGTDPEVSPDGNLVAYISARGKRERLKVKHVYGGPADLLMDAARISSVTWSPESNRIAAVRAPARGPEKLVLVNVPSGGGEHVVARGEFGRVSFSPEGDQLVYSRVSGGRSDIFRFAVGGHGSKRLTYDHRSQAPLWGPRGRIAFLKQVGRKRKLQIYTMRPDGGDVKRLTHTRHTGRRRGLYPVAWSPDGSRLLADVSAPGGEFAVVVYAQSGALGRLRHRKAHFVGTDFSCDGNMVLGSSGPRGALANHKVGLVPTGSGTMQVLANFAYDPDLGGC